MALFYTAVAMAVSSLTTRRAVAAVAIVLVLLVPSIAVGVAVESSGAPDELALLAPPSVAPEFAWRVFGDTRTDRRGILRSAVSRPGSSSPGSRAGSRSAPPSASSATAARRGDDERRAPRATR